MAEQPRPEQDLRAARDHLQDAAAVLRQALAADDLIDGTAGGGAAASGMANGGSAASSTASGSAASDTANDGSPAR
ncbi:hypothetical protein ACQPXM_37270 [Kribbella sp. CA-253562]|uniref:hypothetical protein n=1 Tax=Kribbella sp. CA-253562 TaxID=3239942 RepID=UPI003D90B091